MKKQICLFIFMVCNICCLQSQTLTDSIQKLDAVVLPDVKLKQHTSGIKVTTLSDSVIKKHPGTLLTELLRFNSNIYFRENGYGMVSSASFRGTNASQTAVVWNGININSQLTGQTDFNTLVSAPYNSIEIRSGGGSVQYGTGAIGGSVHLTNKLKFKKHTEQNLSLLYGSFNTKSGAYSLSSGTKKWSVNADVNYISSDNNYKYLGTGRVNENGAFNNLNISTNLGYFLSEKNLLKLYHQSFKADRNLSGTLAADSRSKYKDQNHRTLLEWINLSNKYTSKLRFAHIYENFNFFENQANNLFSEGSVSNLIANYNFDYFVSKNAVLKTVLEYSVNEAKGDSFGNASRTMFSGTLLWNHTLNKFRYGASIRQDVVSDFSSPLVFSIDAKYQLSKKYTLTINGSRNYRIPTFNDLYWQPGGNLNLVPESSYQLDFGQQLVYKDFDIKLNTFYIETRDMIVWQPNTTGIWSPENIDTVKNLGLELEAHSEYTISNNRFDLRANYSYTIAENIETEEQLIYVPFHKASTSLSYGYKNAVAYYQHVFNGAVSIIGGSLDGFTVGNLGLVYNIKTKSRLQYNLHFKISNLFNTYYENVALRPMPNRNYQLQLKLKL